MKKSVSKEMGINFFYMGKFILKPKRAVVMFEEAKNILYNIMKPFHSNRQRALVGSSTLRVLSDSSLSPQCPHSHTETEKRDRESSVTRQAQSVTPHPADRAD